MELSNPLVSFVIPAFNEAESIPALYEGVKRNVERCGYRYEIWFVDDGSTDDTANKIKELNAADHNVHLISFRKNFGKAAALNSGFANCSGDIVITMDADLQDEPDEMDKFIAKLNEGYDMVSGWKQIRNDPLEKRLPSKLFNGTISKMSGIKLHDFNCGYKAYRREVVKSISLYGELHRYIPVLAQRLGFKIAEIPIKHNKRQFGKSKYGFERYLRGLFDAISIVYLSKYYDRPMHFFGRLGLGLCFVGFITCLILLIEWFMGTPIGTRPLLTLGIMLVILGVQSFSIGLIGDMVVDGRMRKPAHDSHIKEKL